MKKIKIISILAGVLMAAILYVGVTSCSEDEKKPEPPDIPVAPLMKRWYRYADGIIHIGDYLEFNTNGTYSSNFPEYGTVNGNYRITEKEKGTYTLELYDGMVYELRNLTLYKMMISGNLAYDEMWAYTSEGGSTLYVYLYHMDTLVRFYMFTHLTSLPGQ